MYREEEEDMVYVYAFVRKAVVLWQQVSHSVCSQSA
jgi:hypothetical protein